MTFSTYELALNQDIQDRLRTEIQEVLDKYNGEVTYDAIKEMKYLDMVFKETLRKYPALDNQNRKSTHDFKIPNSKLVIPAGTNIIIPVDGLHNDERFFENPKKFDPERFTDDNIKKRPSFVYIPFSEGGRMCIGYRLVEKTPKQIFSSSKNKSETDFLQVWYDGIKNWIGETSKRFQNTSIRENIDPNKTLSNSFSSDSTRRDVVKTSKTLNLFTSFFIFPI